MLDNWLDFTLKLAKNKERVEIARRPIGLENVAGIEPDKIRRADILLVHARGSLISFFIRKFTRSYWNHVGLFVSKDDHWPKWVIEAVGGGVVGRPFELKYIKVIRDDDGKILSFKHSRRYRIAIVRVKDLNHEQRKQIAARAYQWAIEERRYDYILLIFGMVLHLLSFRKWYPGWLNVKSRFICSELIAEAFKKVAGFEFSRFTAAGYVTPADIGSCALSKEEVEFVMTNVKRPKIKT